MERPRRGGQVHRPRKHENEAKIWWGEYNRPASQPTFDSILTRLQAFLQDEELFVQDCYVCADPEFRMPVRIITTRAWHSHFARNMFLTTENIDELRRFVPEFTLIVAPKFKVDPRVDGTRTETAILLNFAENLGIVANSSYGGEIKKSVFTVMNYLLPLSGRDGHALLGQRPATTATSPCSSASPARARRPSRPTPSGG